MFNSKYSNFLTVLLVIAIIAIIGLIGYCGYDMYKKYYTDKEAEEAISLFEQQVGEEQPNDNQVTEIDGVDTNSILTGNNKGKTTTTYKGYNMSGIIEIPAIKIKYPILERVTKQSIKVAVAILYGSGLNQEGNTVIVGHNYRNGLFFSNLKKLSNGDSIYITDETGTKVRYKVYNIFNTNAEDTSFYNRDTGGAREITLSTCTDDGSLRTIIFAKAE